jgi:3-phosphoshikimate 1-carboxyvinyltransferase
LLASRIGRWEVRVSDENAEESPYVVLTSRLLVVFPHAGGVFQVEPDASSGSYFWAAGQPTASGHGAEAGIDALSVKVTHWPASGWQIDQRFPQVYSGLQTLKPDAGQPIRQVSRKSDLGDSIMTAIAMAPLLPNPVRFTDLGRLRLQECERVAALRSELTKCGAKVVEEGDTLTVYPSVLHGAEIETYNDHRMAMCFAVLGLRVPGIRLRDPGCVRKTFPNFFQKLALPPPHGLAIVIRDGNTGAILGQDGLFAD